MRNWLRAVLLGTLLAACTSSSMQTDTDAFYDHPPGATVPAAVSDARVAAWADATRDPGHFADLVFVGQVLAVGRSPGVSSGVVVSTQAVHYRVERVLRGPDPGPTAAVHHVLSGPPGEDPEVIRLDPAVWRRGARLIVAARRGPVPGSATREAWWDMVDGPPCVPATPARVATVRQHLDR